MPNRIEYRDEVGRSGLLSGRAVAMFGNLTTQILDHSHLVAARIVISDCHVQVSDKSSTMNVRCQMAYPGAKDRNIRIACCRGPVAGKSR